MPAIDEVTESRIWIKATLLASPAVQAVFGTQVYSHPAPRETPYPHISIQHLTPGNDLMVVGTNTLWANPRFIVQGWDYLEKYGDTRLRPGAVAIYEALHGKFGQTAAASIISCIRNKPFTFIELSDAVFYLRLGGEYYLQVRPLDP